MFLVHRLVGIALYRSEKVAFMLCSTWLYLAGIIKFEVDMNNNKSVIELKTIYSLL